MTQNTASLIASAIQQVHAKLRDGTLDSRLCRDCGNVHKPWLACEPKTEPILEPSRHRGGRPRKTLKPLPVLRAHEMRKESR